MKDELPEGLRSAGAAFWHAVTEEWKLSAAEQKLLLLACRCLDDMEAARSVLARDGLFVVNRNGRTIEHPAVATERKAKSQFATLIEQLDLIDPADKPKVGRPGEFEAKRRLASWQ